MTLINLHRQIGLRLQRKFNISPENTAHMIRFLAREFPTLCLAERTLVLDGARLRMIRRAKHCTIKRLAKKLGMSHQQIANIEKGRSGTTRATFLSIAEALNINVEEISK